MNKTFNCLLCNAWPGLYRDLSHNQDEVSILSLRCIGYSYVLDTLAKAFKDAIISMQQEMEIKYNCF